MALAAVFVDVAAAAGSAVAQGEGARSSLAVEGMAWAASVVGVAAGLAAVAVAVDRVAAAEGGAARSEAGCAVSSLVLQSRGVADGSVVLLLACTAVLLCAVGGEGVGCGGAADLWFDQCHKKRRGC